MKTVSSLFTLALALSAPLLLAPVALHAEVASDASLLAVFQQPTIRVLLAHKSKSALIEVPGRYALVDPKTSHRLSSGLFGDRFTVEPSEKGLVWSNQLPGLYQFQMIPRGADRLFWVNGVQYKGTLTVYQIGDTLSLVNELTVEDYVAAIVASCSDETMPAEAAHALAICARSDAWYHIKNKTDSYWHLYAPDVNYEGVTGVKVANIGLAAAKATEGLFLTHTHFDKQNGLFLSRWTHHSGGATVGYNQLNPEQRELGDFAVDSSAAKLDRERTQWHRFVTQEEVEKAFDLKTGSLKQLSVVREAKSQKVCGLSLRTHDEVKQVSYFKAAQLLGADKIQSSDFEIREMPGHRYELIGYGQGAGVGLCLYTAKQMANQGKMAPQILEQFFPGSKIEMIKMAK